MKRCAWTPRRPKRSGTQPAVENATIEQDGVQLTSISGAVHLPTCRTLFLAQDNRLLWLGNSAGLTAQAASGRFRSPTGNRRYQALHNPRLASPSDLVLLDLAEIRRLIATWVANPPPGKLADLISLANAADALLVEVQCDPAVTAFSLHIACD